MDDHHLDGNIDFVVSRVRHAGRYHAARIAVLTPLVGATWARRGAAGVVDALRRVRSLWHLALRGLLWVGWDAARSLPQLRNCPPFGVDCDMGKCRVRCCRLRQLCPFCYGRQVILVYNAVERALYGDGPYRSEDGRLRRPEKGWYLVGYRNEFYQDEGEIVPDERPLVRLQRNLDLWYDANRSFRRIEYDRARAEGGAVLLRVVPRTDGLTAIRGGVLLARRPVLPREIATADGWFACHQLDKHRSVRKVVAVTVGNALAYPRDLLTGLPPEYLYVFLRSLRSSGRSGRKRLLSRYGVLKNVF
jgi:hypothetical protein